MTCEDLDAALRSVKPGQFADVPYELFAELFPPGINSDASKEAAYNVAKAHGLVIENRPDKGSVWFVRPHVKPVEAPPVIRVSDYPETK